ncbi:MAG: acetyl esterase [Thermoleophilaceae bacterium]|jgi:acetyl esterase|nr:acetyl esterase [Thermoleophilaceae bacterium]
MKPQGKGWLSGWMSIVAGREVEAPTFDSIEDLIAFRDQMSIRDHGSVSDLPSLRRFEPDVVLRGDADAPLSAEIYVPEGSGPFPVVQYMHGGGFAAGNAEHTRKAAMEIAAQGFVVVNVDYRLAPEAPFPGAVEDCVYAARWIRERIGAFDGDPDRIVIGGSSAGANLAAATVIAFQDGLVDELDGGDLAHVPVRFAGALLLYGIFDFCRFCTERPEEWNGMVETMFSGAYLGSRNLSLFTHPLVSPVYATNPGGFPPTYLSCGSRDLLRTHSLALAEVLARAGVATTLSMVDGLDHAFAHVPHALPAARQELDRAYAWLHEVSAEATPSRKEP